MGKHNFVYLLAGLLVFFLTGPVINQFRFAPAMIEVRFAATMILSLWSFAADRRWLLLSLAFAVAAIIAAVAGIFLEVVHLDVISAGALLVFFLFSTVIVTRQVLFRGAIDANKIIGAICIYLLLRFVWALAYTLLDTLSSSAFSGVTGGSISTRWDDLFYYSFITLTTVVYGDITPVTYMASALATLEAVFGQFYIAILVASLVAIYISGRSERRDDR